MLDPVGFWSYTRHDDAQSDGQLSQLRVIVGKAIALQYGADVLLWQDVTAIPFGADWAETIDETLGKTTFFMPIVTPRYLKSEKCFEEYSAFRRRMEELGRKDLVFPVHYVGVDRMVAEDTVFGENLDGLRRHQWIDFRPHLYSDPRGSEVRRWAGELADSILSTLRRGAVAPKDAPKPAAVDVPAEPVVQNLEPVGEKEHAEPSPPSPPPTPPQGGKEAADAEQASVSQEASVSKEAPGRMDDQPDGGSAIKPPPFRKPHAAPAGSGEPGVSTPGQRRRPPIGAIAAAISGIVLIGIIIIGQAHQQPAPAYRPPASRPPYIPDDTNASLEKTVDGGFPVEAGATVAEVQRVFRTQRQTTRCEYYCATQLQLPSAGITFQFDEAGYLSNVQFDPPWRGSASGIKLGDSKQRVEARFGVPSPTAGPENEKGPYYNGGSYVNRQNGVFSAVFDFNASNRVSEITVP